MIPSNIHPYTDHMGITMAEAVLFEGLVDVVKPVRPDAGAGEARVLRPERRQIVIRAVHLDGFLPVGHQARLVWDWVLAQDLSELYAAIKARGSAPGRAAIDPALLLSLWLFAHLDAVGSAREIERLCQRDLAYMWLCGDVGVNYHALSDFRAQQGELVDRLLTQSITGLAAAGLVQLETLAVDGVRVRAHAGQASFRRRPRIEEFEQQAAERVALLKQGAVPDVGTDIEPDKTQPEDSAGSDAGGPDAGGHGSGGHDSGGPGAARDKRQQAAAVRAAKQRVSAIAKAKKILLEREAQREKRMKSNRKATAKQGEVRVSTTDPESRVMKMADGGFRPAYNVQVTTDPLSGMIVATGLDCTGSDKGLLGKAIKAATQRYGKPPKTVLADGGFYATDDIEWAHNHPKQDGDKQEADAQSKSRPASTASGPAEANVITLYVPLTVSKHGSDPHAARNDDGPGVAALRQRMASDEAKALFKKRSQAELPHARLRKTGLTQFTLRSAAKALIQATWHALASNLIIVFGIMKRQATTA